MYFKQFFVDDLAHASYFLGCEKTKKAVVIDPERNVSGYLQEAKRLGMTITHVLETHLHADFVSGHMELAKAAGAKIYISKVANAGFEHTPVKDGDEINVGEIRIKVLETPGHTPEGVCYTVADLSKSKEPKMVFTGDTLFVGSVGRPDLFGAERARELAGQLFDSIHGKLLKLKDEVEVYPAHGAGSFCGAGMSSENSSTIGKEREMNCAFAGKSKEVFIEDLLRSLPQTPTYFRNSAQVNRNGPPLIGDKIPGSGLSPKDFKAAMEDPGTIAVDGRDPASFGEAHVPGAIFVPLGAQFATWVGWLMKPDNYFLFVLKDDREYSAAAWRLLRIGFDRIGGYLEGGLEAWRKEGLPIEVLPQISPEELQRRLKGGDGSPIVLDVRNPFEWEGGHVENALHIPLQQLSQKTEINDRKGLAVICASGNRSTIASSLLAKRGLRNLFNVTGGMNSWRKSGLPATAPSKK